MAGPPAKRTGGSSQVARSGAKGQPARTNRGTPLQKTGPSMPSAGSGGSPRKVPWARRIISTTVLVVVLVALLFGVVKAGSWVKGLLAEEHSKVTQVATPKPVEITPCTSAELGAEITPTTAAIPEGSGFDVAVALKNKGTRDCSFELSSLQVELAGDSGPVWTPTACSGSWDKNLLLGAGKSWTANLSWDGLLYKECELVEVDGVGGTPPAGAYNLKWSAGEAVPSAKSPIRID